jgi:hypothetical protein
VDLKNEEVDGRKRARSANLSMVRLFWPRMCQATAIGHVSPNISTRFGHLIIPPFLPFFPSRSPSSAFELVLYNPTTTTQLLLLLSCLLVEKAERPARLTSPRRNLARQRLVSSSRSVVSTVSSVAGTTPSVSVLVPLVSLTCFRLVPRLFVYIFCLHSLPRCRSRIPCR